MKMLIGPEGYGSTLVECSEEIGENIYQYFEDFFDSDMHKGNWSENDFIKYVQREIRNNSKLYMTILEEDTKKYEGKYPKLKI